MDTLLAKLSEQQVLLEKQKNALSSAEDRNTAHEQEGSISDSVPLTPATDSFNITPSTEHGGAEETVKLDAAEMLRLKKELDAAKDKIALQEQELSQTRNIKTDLGPALGPPANVGAGFKSDNLDRTTGSAQPTILNRPMTGRQDTWGVQCAVGDIQHDSPDPSSSGTFNKGQNIWSSSGGTGFNYGLPTPVNQQFPPAAQIWGPGAARQWGNRPMVQALPSLMMPQQHQMQQRTYSGPSSPVSSGNGRFMNDFTSFQGGPGLRRSNTQNNRAGSVFASSRNNNWDSYTGNESPDVMTGMSPVSAYQPMGMFQAPMSYQPRPIGTPLSPTAAEFTAGNASTNPWNAAVSSNPQLTQAQLTLLQPPQSPGQTYVSPMEPLNYRRLLDRSVTCNWKYIVDKIVCNNDQQASIFLQQKLKVGTVEQKFEIVEAIVAQAYPLMVNRFGNFLVQRCFEHGTPEQVIAIANAIRGNTLSLSMDAFGCHVVQKAFDAVPEDYKAIMVHELLRRIPETVIHRYACHVWQKLFELRWSDSPPQIMKYVNEALRGMWHEVALGETGSLVVQNIFENCLEEDKVC